MVSRSGGGALGGAVPFRAPHRAPHRATEAPRVPSQEPRPKSPHPTRWRTRPRNPKAAGDSVPGPLPPSTLPYSATVPRGVAPTSRRGAFFPLAFPLSREGGPAALLPGPFAKARLHAHQQASARIVAPPQPLLPSGSPENSPADDEEGKKNRSLGLLFARGESDLDSTW